LAFSPPTPEWQRKMAEGASLFRPKIAAQVKKRAERARFGIKFS
jgi:hypothetical protein